MIGDGQGGKAVRDGRPIEWTVGVQKNGPVAPEWGSFRLRVNVESSKSAWEGDLGGNMRGSEGVGALRF